MMYITQVMYSKIHADLLQPIQARRKLGMVSELLTQLATRIGPGGKLPTTRELCRLLRVSTKTLDASLQKLAIQGVIDRKRGSGLYVSGRINQRTIGLLLSRFAFLPNGSPWDGMSGLRRMPTGDRRFSSCARNR